MGLKCTVSGPSTTEVASRRETGKSTVLYLTLYSASETGVAELRTTRLDSEFR